MPGCAVAEKMCSFKVVALFVAACVVGADSQYNYNYDNYNYNPNIPYNNYNNYNTERPQDPILWRAHERTKFEAQLKVSCDTGDDRACFELFLSVHRMALYFTAAILLALILLGACIGICCYCRRKRLKPPFVVDDRRRRVEEPSTLPMDTAYMQQHSQKQPSPTVEVPPTATTTFEIVPASRPRRGRNDRYPTRHSRSTVID